MSPAQADDFPQQPPIAQRFFFPLSFHSIVSPSAKANIKKQVQVLFIFSIRAKSHSFLFVLCQGNNEPQAEGTEQF